MFAVVLVVMSIETYEDMIETARTGAAIIETEQEYAKQFLRSDIR
jgi:hypothetical protein